MPRQQISCPECNSQNLASAKLCRQCGAILHPEQGDQRPLQQKILRRTDFYSAARANRANTNKLILLMVLIGTTLGYLVGWNIEIYSLYSSQQTDVWFLSVYGIVGAIVMCGLGLLWTVIAMRFGDRMVMALTGAHEVSIEEARQLHNVVEEMAIAAGVVKPKVYVIETHAMNAFATGMSPKTAAIAVTRGLLDSLNREELQGVVGHEMGHVVNWDIRYATTVSVFVGLIALVSDGVLRAHYFAGRGSNKEGAGIVQVLVIVFAILAPIAAKLVQMAISRQREFLADATSVRLTRNPLGLVSALQKLSHSAEPFDGANRATQHLFIVNPFRNFSEKAASLMATHPPIERRINRLLNLGSKLVKQGI